MTLEKVWRHAIAMLKITAFLFLILIFPMDFVFGQYPTCSEKDFKPGDEIYFKALAKNFVEDKKKGYVECEEIKMGELVVKQVLTEGDNRGKLIVAPPKGVRKIYCNKDAHGEYITLEHSGTYEINCRYPELIFKRNKTCKFLNQIGHMKNDPGIYGKALKVYGGCHAGGLVFIEGVTNKEITIVEMKRDQKGEVENFVLGKPAKAPLNPSANELAPGVRIQ